jgi:hypothetical protein
MAQFKALVADLERDEMNLGKQKVNIDVSMRKINQVMEKLLL